MGISKHGMETLFVSSMLANKGTDSDAPPHSNPNSVEETDGDDPWADIAAIRQNLKASLGAAMQDRLTIRCNVGVFT